MSSYNFKVVLLGQGCVGKTSLVLRYVSNVYNDSHQSTLQASFLKKQLYLKQDLIKLNIWDTAGQEKFHALGPIYYREAQGAILVYDVTNPDSLKRVRDWVKELNKMLGNSNVRLAIIGNKIDLLTSPTHLHSTDTNITTPSMTQTTPITSTLAPPMTTTTIQQQQKLSPSSIIQNNPLVQEAIQFTEELLNAKHYLTSAKLNQGIGELFVSLSKSMLEQHKRHMAAKGGNANNRLSYNTRIGRTLSYTGNNDAIGGANLNPSTSRIGLDRLGRDGNGGATSLSIIQTTLFAFFRLFLC